MHGQRNSMNSHHRLSWSPVSIRTVYFGIASWILISFIFAYRIRCLSFFLPFFLSLCLLSFFLSFFLSFKLCLISKFCHSIVLQKYSYFHQFFLYWKWLLSIKSLLSRMCLKGTRTIIRNLETNKPIKSHFINLKVQFVGIGPLWFHLPPFYVVSPNSSFCRLLLQFITSFVLLSV